MRWKPLGDLSLPPKKQLIVEMIQSRSRVTPKVHRPEQNDKKHACLFTREMNFQLLLIKIVFVDIESMFLKVKVKIVNCLLK